MTNDFKRAFKATPATAGLVTVMVLVYLWEVLQAHSFTINSQVLFHSGAQFSPAVYQLHQWWRLITAGFLHVTFSHLAFNMITLYFIGRLLEIELGPWRFLALFFLTVISGNLMSLAFGGVSVISAGASGGIFGLFGAIGMLGLLDKRRAYWRSQAKLMGIFILLSIVSSFATPDIDLSAHIGGLLGGFILVPAFISGFHYTGLFKVRVWHRLLAVIVYLALLAVVFGIAINRI
ncbi:rhomboid family intramembrane serine protease [Weissella cibaria]|uniref:rhomboid family intramembrane serine protease n=1 Tax=Weissella cibaria TaxID=137591 RepID=UPI001681479A|nr:rhomboid family intramembrane serine protease [Weissella cibaria]MBD1501187.1 rhomboid family intramembrane serine protease [Weissella cibaria]MCG4286677.1 rhomboid family intramembrane serine protease [Weissella cibaria]